jgi:Flp pilus assembly protein TadB
VISWSTVPPIPDTLHEVPRSQVTGCLKRAIQGYEKAKEDHMIVLGLILLILGWVLGIGILVTIGIILLIIGVVFLVLGQMGRAVGGRKYWF